MISVFEVLIFALIYFATWKQTEMPSVKSVELVCKHNSSTSRYEESKSKARELQLEGGRRGSYREDMRRKNDEFFIARQEPSLKTSRHRSSRRYVVVTCVTVGQWRLVIDIVGYTEISIKTQLLQSWPATV